MLQRSNARNGTVCKGRPLRESLTSNAPSLSTLQTRHGDRRSSVCLLLFLFLRDYCGPGIKLLSEVRLVATCSSTTINNCFYSTPIKCFSTTLPRSEVPRYIWHACIYHR